MSIENDDLEQAMRPGLTAADLDDSSDEDFGDEVAVEAAEAPAEEAPQEPAAESESEAAPEREPEDEGEPGPEESPEPEAEDKPRKPKHEPRIPKSRFDQVNERMKAAERRAAELERERQAADPAKAVNFDFEAKEKAYMEAVLDGESDKALAIRREIRAAEQAVLQARFQETAAATRQATKAELELETTIGELQRQYPVFDGESDQFDQALTDETLELFQGFQRQGYDPASAMRRAVRYTVKMYDLDAAEAAAPATESKSGKPKPKLEPEQVQRKLDIAAKQPPQPAGRSEDELPDIMNMPEEQFDKLSEQDERVLRGDFVG